MATKKSVWKEKYFRGFFVLVFIIFLFLFSLIIVSKVIAVPTGPTLTYVGNETMPPTSAPSRADARGTINTVLFDATQQNYRWKAYVGNVTGTLVLADADSYKIYAWQGLDNYTGEVYATRSSTISWSSIACATLTQIQTEETALNITHTSIDSINSTFNSTVHKEFYVGSVHITQNTCRATRTYINNNPQSESINAKFQEILLADTNNNIVYTTLIENNEQGYNPNDYYDFQMIVPDRGIEGYSPVTYYFFMELS